MLVAAPPRGPGWLHEIKHDGYRIGACLAGAAVTLLSRRGKDWTASFPTVVETLRMLGAATALLDGEVVLLRPDGTGDFGGLRGAAGTRNGRVVFQVFDLLELDGENLRSRPLRERKERLRDLLREGGSAVRFVEHLETDGQLVFEAARGLGAEGIVSKRGDSPYRDGQRSPDWQKTKSVQEEEFLVCGFLTSAGAPLAALHLGEESDGQLIYVGKVGTGFQRVESALLAELRDLVVATCPFGKASRPTGKDFREAIWTRPEVVVEVAYLERKEGGLRHPTFRRLCGKLAEEG